MDAMKELIEAAEGIEKVLDACLGTKVQMDDEEVMSRCEAFTEAIAAIKAHQSKTVRVWVARSDDRQLMICDYPNMVGKNPLPLLDTTLTALGMANIPVSECHQYEITTTRIDG